jgi:hypothetical protein
MSIDLTISAWQLILCFTGGVMWVSKMQFDVMQIKKKSAQSEVDLKKLSDKITVMQDNIMQVLTDIRIALERKVDRHG